VPLDRLTTFGYLFSLKSKNLFWQSKNIIIPLQNLLESLFSVHFENTFPARLLQAISQHMADKYELCTGFLPRQQVQASRFTV